VTGSGAAERVPRCLARPAWAPTPGVVTCPVHWYYADP